MIRRLIILGVSVVLLPLGAGLYVLTEGGSASAMTPRYNNATDTVNCSSFFGKTTISPPLVLGGTTPTTITIKGKLYGCTDTTPGFSGTMVQSGGGNVPGSPAVKTGPMEGVVSGTLTGANNNLTGLLGCSSITSGTITITWKGLYQSSSGAPLESLTNAKTFVNPTQIYGNLFSPGSPFGATDNPTTDGYGYFEIGKNAVDNGCTASTIGAGSGFVGTDNGASGSSIAVTSLDASALLNGQAVNGTDTEDVLNIGLGALSSG